MSFGLSSLDDLMLTKLGLGTTLTLASLFSLLLLAPVRSALGDPLSTTAPVSQSTAPVTVRPSTEIKDAKFRFTASMQQAKYAFHSFETRRQFQWQFNIALWTVLLVAIRFLDQQEVRFPLWVGVIALIAHAVWERGIWAANYNDKSLADFFRKYAYEVLIDPNASVPRNWPPKLDMGQIDFWIGWVKDWSHLFEWGVTLAIIVGAYVLLGKKHALGRTLEL